MKECIKCKNEATLRLTPDLDVRGISVCENCKDDVKTDLMIEMQEPGYFEKKYFKS